MDEAAAALKALAVLGALTKTSVPASFKLMSFEAVVTPPVSLTTALVPPSATPIILLKKVELPMVLRKPLLAGAMAMSQPVAVVPKAGQTPPPAAVSAKSKVFLVSKVVPAFPLAALESRTLPRPTVKFVIAPPQRIGLRHRLDP